MTLGFKFVAQWFVQFERNGIKYVKKFVKKHGSVSRRKLQMTTNWTVSKKFTPPIPMHWIRHRNLNKKIIDLSFKSLGVTRFSLVSPLHEFINIFWRITLTIHLFVWKVEIYYRRLLRQYLSFFYWEAMTYPNFSTWRW